MDRPATSLLCSPTKKHLPCHEHHRSPPEQIGRKAPCSEIESKLCGAEWEGAAAKCLCIIYYVCTVHRWNLLLRTLARTVFGEVLDLEFLTPLPTDTHTHTHVRGYHTEATTDHLEGVWKALSLGAAKRAALNAFSTIRNCFFVVLFSLDDVRCCSSLIWLKTTFGFDVVIVVVRGGAAGYFCVTVTVCSTSHRFFPSLFVSLSLSLSLWLQL